MTGNGSSTARRYAVMFLLEATAETIDGLRARWSSLGESVVVAGDTGAWNCHIHTDHVGPAIEAALDAGRPRGITVTDLLGPSAPRPAPLTPFEPRVEAAVAPVGVVAVVAGSGLVQSFSDLLVQGIVSGGPAMNPSVDDLVAVVDAVPATRVVVLPNNRNLVPVAEEVDALTTKDVVVVPTRSVQQGLAAMLGYSTGEESLEDAALTMSAAASSIISAEVTRAVRDARVEGLGAIAGGDWMGVLDGTPIVTGPDPWSAVSTLVRRVMTAPIDLITVYTGVNADRDLVEALREWTAAEYPFAAIEVRDGGHPSSPYLLSFE